MKITDFAVHLRRFFEEHLAAQRNASPNTVRSYRDTFVQLIRYCNAHGSPAPERLEIEDVDVALIRAFLRDLDKRGVSARTRNQRLSAIHSFFRYLQTEDPPRMMQCQQVLSLPMQRWQREPVSYLTRDDLQAILAAPDLAQRQGRRDAVLLSVLYDTGARVQELVDLSVRDVRLAAPAQVHLTGKGKKTRVVPLMSSTVCLLREYVREHKLDQPGREHWPLFRNCRDERLTRAGVAYLLNKYVTAARQDRPLLPRLVTPHVLRHSKAMHLLQSGCGTVAIQAILGHANIRTSGIYVQADLEMTRKALEQAEGVVPGQSSPPTWQTNPEIMKWLASL